MHCSGHLQAPRLAVPALCGSPCVAAPDSSQDVTLPVPAAAPDQPGHPVLLPILHQQY